MPKSAITKKRCGFTACSIGGLKAATIMAGDYSIADIATWPWIARFEWHKVDLNQFPNVKRWYVSIAKRPAVQKGYQVPKDAGPVPMP